MSDDMICVNDRKGFMLVVLLLLSETDRLELAFQYFDTII